MKTKLHLFKAFLWFSNTDPKLFQQCPTNVRWKRIGLSLFVLVTGVFAFITSSYFVRTLFQTYNEYTHTLDVNTAGWVISLIIGLIWAVFIINLDRMIISSNNRWMTLIRIPLAIAIGIIVSLPLEVQLFSSRINKALVISSRSENQSYEQKYNTVVNKADAEIEKYKNLIEIEKNEMAKWKDIMESETVGRVKAGRTGKAGQGPAWQEAKENYDLHNSFLQNAETQLQSAQQNYGSKKNDAKSELEQKTIDQSFDFASQFEQLQILKEDDKYKSLKFLANAITALFILIELIPALMKLMTESDEYDQLLKARAYLNEQTINVIVNVALEEIETNKIGIFSGSAVKYQPTKILPQITQILN